MTSLASARDTPLRTLVVRSSILESMGFAVQNGLRLAANLVLTRILFPEAFGLMALVTVFLVALQLFSDLGLNASVIQNERGDDANFLNTVWTLQAFRGVALWLGCVLGATPIASFYGEPLLAELIPFVGLSALLAGFNSTSMLSARRHLRLGVLAAIEIGASVASIAVMLTWALISPSVWALAGGGIARALIVLVASHCVTAEHKNRFVLDRAAAKSVLHFGKWIFFSTALHFVSQQLDRAALGRLVGLDVLGVYSVAVMLAGAFGDLAVRLTHGVIFPALSQARRVRPRELSRVYYRVRLRLDAILLPALGGLSVLGSELVALLYDERFLDAGWMLEAFSIRVALSCPLTQCETCLFALGHSRYATLRNVARAAWLAIGIPAGWNLLGMPGVVWAVSLSELPVLAVLWAGARRHGILQLRRELLSLGLYLLGVAIALICQPLLSSALLWD